MSSNHLENTTSCLIQKGVAGFGNRIFALAGAITYAEMTGRRLYVDWRDNRYAPDGINAFPLYFTSSVISEDIHTPEEPSVYPKIWHDNLNLDLWGLETKMEGAPRPGPDRFGFRRRKYSANLGKLDYAEDILIFFDYFFPKRLITKIRKNKLKQTGDPYETSLRLALAKISPKESITNAVENFWKPIGSSQVIGVHIRATDKNVYVAGSAAEKKLDTTLRKLKSEHSDAIILLCTDSKEVEQRIQKKFGDVLTTPKMLFSDRKPIHYGIDSNDRISMATSALVDLYLLARCHYLVYSSDSTFGLLARYLSQQPTGRFFDVTPSWGIFGQRS